ncbi:MAG: 50S ribosomal protein L24e [Nitrosopumilaceae archaeon]|nr:50S ribosomal protein L24e [Nitrosopumilaceae archaeon]
MLVQTCKFCGGNVLLGSGIIFAKNDGTILVFCSSKCKKNMLVLKRDPRKLKWTSKYVKGGIKVR